MYYSKIFTNLDDAFITLLKEVENSKKSSNLNIRTIEKDGEITHTLNLAGTPKKNISLEDRDKIIHVQIDNKDNEQKYEITKNTSYDYSKSKAEYKNGLLTITVPKMKYSTIDLK